MLNRAAAFLCVVLGFWAISARPGAQAVAQRPDIQARFPATATEKVSVIVGLRTPFVAQADLESPNVAAAQRGLAQREAARQMQATVLARLAGRGVGNTHAFETIPFIAMEVDASAFTELANMPEVASIVDDRLNAPFLPNSTLLIGAQNLWASGVNGNGVAVAVLDTGVEKTHPMMLGRVISEACYSSNACPNGQTVDLGPGAGEPCNMFARPDCAHGTHVAGIAAGKASGASSVAPNASVIAIQVFHYTDTSLSASDSNIIKGLERVLALHTQGTTIAAANLSLGGGSYPGNCDASYPAFKAAIDNLRSVGIATVVASGNDSNKSGMAGPACISTAVSVGNTTKADAVWGTSNSSSVLNLLAPGTAIYSAYPGGTYNHSTGTSMAAPHVTGAWALLKHRKPGASVTEVLNALVTTGTLITDTNLIAKPRINLRQAMDALDGTGSPGVITSPTDGTQLPGSTVTFQWSAGSNVSEFYLYVGTSPGGYNLYEGSQGTALSRTIAGLPTNGGTIYVRLFSKIAGTYRIQDASFTTKNIAQTPAVITSPSPGSSLSSTSVTFQWDTGVGVTEYYLYVGTSFDGYDIYHGSQGTGTSRAVSGLPGGAQTVYVTLFSRINGVYQVRRTSYTALDGRAAIYSPTNGAALTHSNVTFYWNAGTGVSEYYLYVGSSPGGYDILDAAVGTSTSRAVVGIPTDGRTIYVRLWSKTNGALRYRDTTYTAAVLAQAPAQITFPGDGSTLGSTSASFSWSTGVGVTEYYLYVGRTRGGYDLYNASEGTNTSRTVTGLPADGSPIHVTLWSRINGVYQVRYYTYTAVEGRAVITSPTPGSTLPGRTATLGWSAGIGVTEYYLYVGTTLGGYDIYERSQGTARSAFVSGFPTNMQPVYVRLWSKINGMWTYKDFVFSAA